MPQILSAKAFLELGKKIPIVDVRTPAEFEIGHIPGAVNIPIFTNEERAKVGTKYKRASKESAVLLGLELVGPKLAKFVRMAKKIAPERELLIHCWRGGMRSGSMAWLFETAGFKAHLLEGGYKAYRAYLREQFEREADLVVLGGMTGSGKTAVLHAMQQQNAQVLDLEGIAHHKGSVFGALGQKDQPTNENFDNLLGQAWLEFDFSRPIWLEDESKAIGSVWINDILYNRIRSTTVIDMDIPKSERVKRLVKEYACFDKEVLRQMVEKIQKRLGGQNVKDAFNALDNDDYAAVADITLSYYDKAYRFGLEKREKNTVFQLQLPNDNPEENAKAVLEYWEELQKQ